MLVADMHIAYLRFYHCKKVLKKLLRSNALFLRTSSFEHAAQTLKIKLRTVPASGSKNLKTKAEVLSLRSKSFLRDEQNQR